REGLAARSASYSAGVSQPARRQVSTAEAGTGVPVKATQTTAFDRSRPALISDLVGAALFDTEVQKTTRVGSGAKKRTVGAGEGLAARSASYSAGVSQPARRQVSTAEAGTVASATAGSGWVMVTKSMTAPASGARADEHDVVDHRGAGAGVGDVQQVAGAGR